MATGIGIFGKTKEKWLSTGLSWLATSTIKAMAVDLSQWGSAITGATNATPIVVTSTSHGITAGQKQYVLIAGVGGNTAANGYFEATGIDANTFSLQDPYTGANIAGSGAYTSGGRLVKLDQNQYLSDVPSGARGVVSSALTNKSVTLGKLYGDTGVTNEILLSAVTNGFALSAILILNDTGTPSTADLIAAITEATNLPTTATGADVKYSIAGGAIARV